MSVRFKFAFFFSLAPSLPCSCLTQPVSSFSESLCESSNLVCLWNHVSSMFTQCRTCQDRHVPKKKNIYVIFWRGFLKRKGFKHSKNIGINHLLWPVDYLIQTLYGVMRLWGLVLYSLPVPISHVLWWLQAFCRGQLCQCQCLMEPQWYLGIFTACLQFFF